MTNEPPGLGHFSHAFLDCGRHGEVTTALFRALAFSQKKSGVALRFHRTPRIRATDIPGIQFEILCASGRNTGRLLPAL
jgi:hypothetical protein